MRISVQHTPSLIEQFYQVCADEVDSEDSGLNGAMRSLMAEAYAVLRDAQGSLHQPIN